MAALDERLREDLLCLARQAGKAIMQVYQTDLTFRTKNDGSAVTDADIRAEEVILAGLDRLSPGVPVISEESASPAGAAAPRTDFWLVDPLDGTREFINRNGEFTVNIALVSEGVPVLGVVTAPALDLAYVGAAGGGAWEERRGVRRLIGVSSSMSDAGPIVVSSRSHGDDRALAAFLAGRPVSATRGVGSALKFCLVAAGEAHLYPRLGPTMEWDTAAGQAVLTAAGGIVSDLSGQTLRYGKEGFRNPSFVASCPSVASWPGGGR